MKRLINALSFAIICVIPFTVIVALGAVLGIVLAPLVHGSLLTVAITLAAISFLVIAIIYYWMNS